MLFAWVAQQVGNLWRRQALQNKLSFCLVCITVFPLLATFAITHHKGQLTLTRLVVERNLDVAERTAEDIDRMFSEKVKMLRIAANSSEMKSMIPDAQKVLLKAIADADSDIQVAIVADSAGNQIARSDGQAAVRSITYRDRYYYQQIKQTGETVFSSVLVGRSTGAPAIVIAEPIKDDYGQLAGILIANVNLHKIIDRINQIKIGQTGYAYMVTHDGRILLHPDRRLVERSEDVSHLAPVKALMNKQAGVAEYEFNNQKKFAAYSFIPQTGWGLVVQQPMEEALYDVSDVKRKAIMITFLAALLAGIFGITVARMMTKPIVDIAAAADRLAAGNLDASCQVDTQDEIGHLARTFNYMAAELRKRTIELQANEEKYRSVVENINLGIYRRTVDDESYIGFANPALVRILGYDSVEELLMTPLPMHFWDRDEFAAINDIVQKTGFIKNREVRLRTKAGNAIWCSLTAVQHDDLRRNIACVDGVIEDITERKQSDARLRQAHADLERKVAERTRELTIVNEQLYLATLQDGLTSIANRRYFNEFLEREWRRAKREQTSIALILLDVDFFKLYNDTYGHVAGDECLIQIAKTLRGIAKRATDLVARYGGEEFALILPETDQAGAMKVGERILAQVRALAIQNVMSPVDQVVTVSLGVAAANPTEDLTSEMLVRAADQALYRVKESGRNHMQVANFMEET